MGSIVGRKNEIEALNDALNSGRAELVVVYGRRRIGKTYLVRHTYEEYIKFELTGMYKSSLKDQLLNFHLTLNLARVQFAKLDPVTDQPQNWIEAFHRLSEYLSSFRKDQRKVIFIDEFPWLDSRKSKFLPAFENFWNAYASKQDELTVVVCGSAASYMIQKIINSKGGLHNRLTRRIHLMPFKLFEVEALLRLNGVDYTRYDILLIYMILGGVPHYIDKIQRGESVAQVVNRLCFNEDGFLRSEFGNIFASLFQAPENHEAIVRTLAKVRKGLTRTEIQLKSRIDSGGTFSKTLKELELSGFVERYMPYQGKRNSLYRLADEYALFYLKFIEPNNKSQSNLWLKLQSQQSFKIWSGFTFETVCMKHISQILKALKISGIGVTHGSWIERGSNAGAQIDLIIDRDDNAINLCEIKYSNGPYVLDKKYSEEIINKKTTFANLTETRKSIFVTFLTTYGLKQNKYSSQIVHNDLDMTCLFKEQ